MVHAPSRNVEVLQTSVPEAMVHADLNETYFGTPVDTENFRLRALVRLGHIESAAALVEQISGSQIPMVIDADALNIWPRTDIFFFHSQRFHTDPASGRV